MKALDLFCGAGGASMGLSMAGFEVHGVDKYSFSEYPFPMTVGDAVDFPIEGYDFVWASPPCQAFTAYRNRANHVAPAENLIPAIREKLKKWGGPYVIENVPKAPLENPITLCGSMFGLDVKRHRIFETNFPVAQPKCQHNIWTRRFPNSTNRPNLRYTVEVGVWRIPLEVQSAAMGINWMSRERLSQAIPPSYSKFLAEEALKIITPL
jgi:DNA (cytosine-5)-methyltransferase 1